MPPEGRRLDPAIGATCPRDRGLHAVTALEMTAGPARHTISEDCQTHFAGAYCPLHVLYGTNRSEQARQAATSADAGISPSVCSRVPRRVTPAVVPPDTFQQGQYLRHGAPRTRDPQLRRAGVTLLPQQERPSSGKAPTTQGCRDTALVSSRY